MNMNWLNEGKADDAVIRHIEARDGADLKAIPDSFVRRARESARRE
jgi:hypothetical protein